MKGKIIQKETLVNAGIKAVRRSGHQLYFELGLTGMNRVFSKRQISHTPLLSPEILIKEFFACLFFFFKKKNMFGLLQSSPIFFTHLANFEFSLSVTFSVLFPDHRLSISFPSPFMEARCSLSFFPKALLE